MTLIISSPFKCQSKCAVLIRSRIHMLCHGHQDRFHRDRRRSSTFSYGIRLQASSVAHLARLATSSFPRGPFVGPTGARTGGSTLASCSFLSALATPCRCA